MKETKRCPTCWGAGWLSGCHKCHRCGGSGQVPIDEPRGCLVADPFPVLHRILWVIVLAGIIAFTVYSVVTQVQ